MHDDNVKDIEKEVFVPSKDVIDKAMSNSHEVLKDPKYKSPKPYTLPLPFPQRMAKAKVDLEFEKVLEVLKKLYINILFTNALSQVSCKVFDRDFV